MKHGQRPTLKQKTLLAGARLNPDNWFVTKALPEELHLEHRYSGKERILKLGRTG